MMACVQIPPQDKEGTEHQAMGPAISCRQRFREPRRSRTM